MKITLEELYKGKATKIKNNNYFTPEQYVAPFLERISKFANEIIINVKPSDQITFTRDGEVNFEDILYNRVWIQGIIPIKYQHVDFKRTINMCYALDSRKPIVKFYIGALRNGNLYTFNSENISIKEIKPENAIDFSPIEILMQKEDDTDAHVSNLEKEIYNKESVKNNLGFYIENCINMKYNNDFGLIKLSESTPIDAYKDLFYDEKSKVFVNKNQISKLELYNAFANILTEDSKDFINRFEKSLLINRIISNDN